jgi:serine/threonine protein kinase
MNRIFIFFLFYNPKSNVCSSLFLYIFINRAAGDVDLALDTKTNTKIAIKRMLWSKQPRKELIVSEIHVMKNFRFRSIVNFLDCYLRPNELWSTLVYL